LPKYEVIISKKARKELDKLPDSLASILFNEIYSLEDNPRPRGCKKLTIGNAYRIRVGDYRIIYDIIDKQLIVNVITLGHKKEIYK
jgi:mRNA interferase RelE/StbE